MGYQALLFCPDEKTARTVTQVLSELEFDVEACTEPFAAVKKLMSQHFDAVVVDCDNEQNATLLFKSARNSASNQASLAVAVVEGQAGVAKAFRIGANLVLTKPINIEQAKGTLRVARGLLRKGEPAKAGTTATSQAAPVAPKSVSATKPEAAGGSAAISTAAVRAKADTTLAAVAAVASSSTSAQDDDLLDIGGEEATPKSSDALAKPTTGFITPSSDPDKFLAAAMVSAEPSVRTTSNSAPAAFGGAASAPAPARERQEPRVAEVPTERPTETAVPAKKEEGVQSESHSYAGSAPTFTFGETPAESSGSGKKIFLGIAAAAIIVVAVYAGLAHLKGRSSEPESTQTETTSAPFETQPTSKQSNSKPSAAGTMPKTTTTLPSSQTAGQTTKGHAPDEFDSALDDADSSSPTGSTKPSNGGDTAATTPLVVKAGKAPLVHTKPGADAPAPSMLEIPAAGETAPPLDLGSGSEIMPKPLPQALNISQGISRGLLTKKVQPVYPKNALAMRVEGAVELMATISKSGDISHLKVLNGDSQLARAATEAVKQWKYKPYLLNGEPVEIQTQITINFKLPK